MQGQRLISHSTRWLLSAVLCAALLACATAPHAARNPAEDAVLIDQLPTPSATIVQPLATGDRAREQQRLTRGLDALLDGRFQVRAHRLFVLDGDTDWIGVKAFARGHIENQFGGMWLDAPPANEDVSAMVWRTARPTTGYVALAWLQPDDEAAPNDRNLVFGYFELEKNAGAPADLENPKAHMFGGAR